MPFKLTERDDGGLLCEFSGQVTIEDTLAARREGLGRVEHYSYVIADYTHGEDYTHTSEQVKRLAYSLDHILNNYPKLVVAIAAPKDLVFGMTRMGQGYIGDNERLRIFRTLDEAEIWVYKKLSELRTL